MAESREDIVRRGYKAFAEGDMDTLGSLYTDDVVQSMSGNNQLSGEYKGRDNVLGLYGRLFDLSGGTFKAELKSVKTEGDKVVSVHHSTAQRGGKNLDDGDESIAFSFAGDDKITRLDLASGDQAAADDFWA